MCGMDKRKRTKKGALRETEREGEMERMSSSTAAGDRNISRRFLITIVGLISIPRIAEGLRGPFIAAATALPV